MRWSLHSSEPKKSSELKAHLEAELEHHDKTLEVEFQRHKLAALEAEASGAPPVPEELAPTARTALHDATRAQALKAIEAASSLAQAMGDANSLLLVSLYGHVDPESPDGIRERVSVNIDLAPDPQ